MMPIEPGCLAMIVGHPNPENNGRVVTVLSFAGTNIYKPGAGHRGTIYIGRRWTIDQKIILWSYGKHGPGDHVDHVSEDNLRRLDDYNPEEDDINVYREIRTVSKTSA